MLNYRECSEEQFNTAMRYVRLNIPLEEISMEKENELHFACEDCPHDYHIECRSIWSEGLICKRDSDFASFDELLLDKR